MINMIVTSGGEGGSKKTYLTLMGLAERGSFVPTGIYGMDE